MRYAALSETGRVRDNNEDSFHADGRIFIVADGMGGHRAGEVASSAAIEGFLRYEKKNHSIAPLERLQGGILAANTALFRMAKEDPGLEGMGTTFTALLVDGGIWLGHVGDSRAYLWREGELRPLTRDHSLVERMVREGFLTPDEARIHPQRNVILRALGVSGDLEVDSGAVDAMQGDRLLLCSDGLTGAVEDAEIAAIVSSQSDPEERCRRLVESANAHGGTDNITVVAVDLESEAGTWRTSGGPRKRPWWRIFSGRKRR